MSGIGTAVKEGEEGGTRNIARMDVMQDVSMNGRDDVFLGHLPGHDLVHGRDTEGRRGREDIAMRDLLNGINVRNGIAMESETMIGQVERMTTNREEHQTLMKRDIDHEGKEVNRRPSDMKERKDIDISS